ncbi:MAG: zinc ribbon domain-containing protein [Vicinamibacterales bacterium]
MTIRARSWSNEVPLYEYQCDACGKRFDIIQKFSDPPPDACRLCGKGPAHRLMSSPAIQFKGSGFYITDYAKKNTSEAGGSSAAKAESTKSDAGTGEGVKADAGKTGTAKSDTGKAETKSETKSETRSQSKSESAPPKPASD